MGVAVAIVVPSTPAAAARVLCNPVTYRYEVREAGAGIGELRVSTNVCREGTTMTSSTASVRWSPNPLGTAAGWRYAGGGLSRISTTGYSAFWKASGTFKLCVVISVSKVCSFPETFSVVISGYARGTLRQALPRFACTNEQCKAGMTFVYKGRG
jgi:hypothetical protein